MNKLEVLQAKFPNKEIKLRDNGSYSIATKFIDSKGKKEKSLTQQEFKNEVDINQIMKKYKATGIVTHIMQGMPMFDDVSELMTYQEALNLQISADANFKKLPAKIRARFGNKAENLISFLDDRSNYDEAVKLGLIDKKPQEKPAPAAEPPKSSEPAASLDPKANPS